MTSTVLLLLLIKQSQLQYTQVIKSLNNIESWLYMVAAMFVFAGTVVLHSVRTQIIFFDGEKPLNSISSYASLAVGNFYNCLLPGNLGEGVRAWHFSRVNKLPLTSSVAVIIVEKVTDAALVIPLFFFALIYLPFINHEIQYTYLFVTISIIGGLLVLMIVLIHKKTLRKVVKLFPSKKTQKLFFKTIFYFKTYQHRLYRRNIIFPYAILSYSMFLLNVMQYLLVIKGSLPLYSPQDILSAYCIALTMIIVAFVPSAPSNVGVAHYGFYATFLMISNISGVQANEFMLQNFALTSICIHLTYIIPELAIGLYFLMRDRDILYAKSQYT